MFGKGRRNVPKKNLTLHEMLEEDENILSEAEKKRMRGIILYNCPNANLQHIIQQLTQANMLEKETKIVEVLRIGKQEGSKVTIEGCFSNHKTSGLCISTS